MKEQNENDSINDEQEEKKGKLVANAGGSEGKKRRKAKNKL